MSSISRRYFVASGALGAAGIVSPGFAATQTRIARAWTKAEALRTSLEPHRPAIEAALRSGGVPGWMRLKGDAYTLGESRYGLLVEILNATPTSHADLAIQRRAAGDPEMIHGPRDWARARVTLAEGVLQNAA